MLFTGKIHGKIIIVQVRKTETLKLIRLSVAICII